MSVEAPEIRPTPWAPERSARRTLTRRYLRRFRRALVAVLGAGVLALGFAFLFLPAPGSVVIPLGLAILGTEFSWAKKLTVHVRRLLSRRARAEGTSLPEVVLPSVRPPLGAEG